MLLFFRMAHKSVAQRRVLFSPRVRWLSTQSRLNDFQDLFVEARYSIEDAKDSVGTVYFEEDSEEASQAVEAAIASFDALVKDLAHDPQEQTKVLRSNGLKVEQLKGELKLLFETH